MTSQRFYDTTAFLGKADYVLQHVDKTEFLTQILYDRVFPWARLDVLNLTGSDTSSYKHFKQAIFELYNSSYNATATPDPADVKALVTQQVLQKKVPIRVIRFQYNWIDTLALQFSIILLLWQDFFFN